MGDPLPPHDTAAEAALLGAIFIRPSLMEKVASVLVVDDFFMPRHRDIYAAMLEAHAAGKPVDPIVVAARMRKGDMAELMTLAEGWTVPDNAGIYAREVRECAALRQLIAIGVEAQSIAMGRNRRAYDIAGELIAMANDVRTKVRPLKAVPNETTRRKVADGKG